MLNPHEHDLGAYGADYYNLDAHAADCRCDLNQPDTAFDYSDRFPEVSAAEIDAMYRYDLIRNKRSA